MSEGAIMLREWLTDVQIPLKRLQDHLGPIDQVLAVEVERFALHRHARLLERVQSGNVEIARPAGFLILLPEPPSHPRVETKRHNACNHQRMLPDLELQL